MKKVLDAHTVAHLFAYQSQDTAYTQTRNFYFSGKSIYSYGSHFCIAKFADPDTLLFTLRGYSNTTAKHISLTAQATRHINKIFCAYPDGGHTTNLEYWQRDAENIADKLLNARKPEKYISEIQHIKQQVTKYTEYFNIDIPAILNSLLDVANKEQYIKHVTNVADFRHQEYLRAKRASAKQHAKELKEFRAGKRESIYTSGKYDYIRVTDENFVTSQRICIPINIGLRLYKTIRTLKPGDAFLSYQVKNIDSKHIQIGCHKIAFKEIDNAVNKVTQLV